jgi:hypothetical protein
MGPPDLPFEHRTASEFPAHIVHHTPSRVQEPFAATQSMTKDDVAKMFEGEDEIKDYPSWTKTVDQINEQVRVQREVLGGLGRQACS